MASDLVKEQHINYLVIEKTIAHKFSVGMSLTGDFGTQEDENFLACWRREIVDNHEIEKVRLVCSYIPLPGVSNYTCRVFTDRFICRSPFREK